MSVEMTVEEAEQELYLICSGRNTNSFLGRLFVLASEADTVNRLRLKEGFPTFISVVEKYNDDEDYWWDLKERCES